MERPESTLGVILALILTPLGVIFQIYRRFLPYIFQFLFFDAGNHANVPSRTLTGTLSTP